jgi:predicted dehydrogenase
MAKRLDHGLQRLALVGGGRWARVLAGVLLEVTPATVQIDIHTASNPTGMGEWSARHGCNRVCVVTGWPEFHAGNRPDAVIVANAARDHTRAAGAALRAGVPTLVEKPLALSERNARELVELASRHGALLAVSRVLLFAHSVERFAPQVVARAPAKCARLAWTDPKIEIRYGEAKRYDASIPVLIDMLPHILPILRAIFGQDAEFISLTIAHGGAETEIRMKVAGLPCFIILARDADTRRRMIEVESSRGQLRLDLSEGCGRIFGGQEELNEDPAGSSTPGPLAVMLRKFLECAAVGRTDDRLSPATAVEECRIADRMLPIYRRKQAEWLAARLDRQVDPGIRYALSELLYGIALREPLEDGRLATIWREIANLSAAPLVEILVDPVRRNQELRRLLARTGRSVTVPN